MLKASSRMPQKVGLIALMVLGALVLWFGSPVLWLWIGSQVTDSQQAQFGPYVLVAVGIIGTTIAVSMVLARLHRAYERVTGRAARVRVRLPWMKSLRDERSTGAEVTVLDLILVVTALCGLTAFLLWFALLAGSPLPSS